MQQNDDRRVVVSTEDRREARRMLTVEGLEKWEQGQDLVLTDLTEDWREDE